MKLTSLLFSALLSLLVLCSCDKKQYAIDNLSNLVEKVEKNASKYTDDDWKEVNKEYDEIVAKIDKYEYSADDTERIAKLKGRFLGIKAKNTIGGFMDGIDKAAQGIKGAIEGFTKEVTGTKDSQEE